MSNTYNIPEEGHVSYDSSLAVNSPSDSQEAWIAIQPPLDSGDALSAHSKTGDLPSFHDSQFNTILRRQRQRPLDNSGLKIFEGLPSRFIHLSNAFEFSGWGSMSNITLTHENYAEGDRCLERMRKEQILGQFTASALAGNAVLGSVFYALPAVVRISGIYTPISLFLATLVLYLWRPIMVELASALPMSGAPYTYLLNVTTKTFALVGASLLLLDFTSTSIVSAATAASYLSGEVPTLPFPTWVGAVILLLLFLVVSLTGIRESARIALAVLSLHIGTMAVLIVVAIIHWIKTGNSQLKANWELGRSESSTPGSVIKQLYYGFCLGMLGLTGFECIPSYVSRILPGKFPLVLRNLHIPAIILNTAMMLLLLAIVPLPVITGGVNLLSILAETSSGRWLRLWVVVDAVIVLSGGVLTGILSACELLQQLALHRIIPNFFLYTMPISGSPYISVTSFVALCGVLYAVSQADLNVISQMFSIVWLIVMSLFPISLLLLRFNRRRIKRDITTGFSVIIVTILLVLVVFAGNVAVNPLTAGYFAIYFVCILTFFSVTQNKIHLLRILYWTYDQYPLLHKWFLTRSLGGSLNSVITNFKKQPVCIFAKSDEINYLFRMISYVRHNEETSYLKIVHFCDKEKGVPPELKANAKILDEVFPEITIDLLLVHDEFNPRNVAALAHYLNTSASLMCMSCPGMNFPYSVAEFGTRIISL